MHDLETIVRMNKDVDMQAKQMKREEKTNQLRNAISRIMRDYTIDIGTFEDMQSVFVIPERNYDVVKELILHEVKVRFPVAG